MLKVGKRQVRGYVVTMTNKRIGCHNAPMAMDDGTLMRHAAFTRFASEKAAEEAVQKTVREAKRCGATFHKGAAFRILMLLSEVKT